MHSITDDYIVLEKVGTNNLKNIDALFPIGKITAVTGVSGSGKSSLVFDTLYGESYRRYVESLSSFARQYLKALPKPILSNVKNLPPAIALKQSRLGMNSRSTVGTMTEMYDILSLIFQHLAHIECPACHDRIEKDTPLKIFGKITEHFSSRRVLILAPLAEWKDLNQNDSKKQLMAQGFSRILKNGIQQKLEDFKTKDLSHVEVLLDRLTITGENKSRILTSLELGLKVGKGKVVVAEDDDQGEKKEVFSSSLDCPRCGIHFSEPSFPLLTFNHPLGACKSCQGFGYEASIDWEKVIPDPSKSLSTKGVAPWNFGSHAAGYQHVFEAAKKRKIDIKKPFQDYTTDEMEWLKSGDRHGFKGILGYFSWLDSKRYKPHYRIHAARYRTYLLCKTCHGKRLNETALACKIEGHSISDVSQLSLHGLHKWLYGIERNISRSKESDGVLEALDEGKSRLDYLLKIGVGYLTLDRSARTLSGGELQRINMARCLGSALTETLFCLDEPSSGLHARDTANLLQVLVELRGQGNTVVVVEHDRSIIEGSDHMLEIGPKAGHLGGQIVYEGSPKSRPIDKCMPGTTVTQPYRAAKEISKHSLFIELLGAKTNNLKNVSVKIPTRAVTCVCGVSGSGKTSLVQHTLYPFICRLLGKTPEQSFVLPIAEEVRPSDLSKTHDDIMLVTQAPPGRSTRSNIATYLGVFDEIRKILASTPLATGLKLTPGHFSFNVPGGRCEICSGLGTVVEDLSFLGEMEITCPSCEGRRFGDQVLSVAYRGKSLIDILSLTVAQAREFFFDKTSISKVFDECIELGLGYLTLGQHTSSFSGGEAQRLKILHLLKNLDADKKPSILIFDEPSTGLSDLDVEHLILQFKTLANKGFTVIIVEHHAGILTSGDWLIEIGPEAAENGGQVIYQGPVAGILKIGNSITAPYLSKVLQVRA